MSPQVLVRDDAGERGFLRYRAHQVHDAAPEFRGCEIPSGPVSVLCGPEGRFVPLWERITFCEKGQDFTAGFLIEQLVYEAVGSIDDIDYQALHFVVVNDRALPEPIPFQMGLQVPC